jgi:hypothetical protein
VYTLTNGYSVRSATTWDEAMDIARKWSRRSRQVISVVCGSSTYTYVYSGREITGREADTIWKSQEVYEDSTYSEAVM